MKKVHTFYFTRVSIIFIMMSVFSTSLLAQEPEKLHFKIKFTVDKGKLDNALITITRDGAPYRIIDPNKGKYNINLELGSSFIFVFSKPGYITKSVVVDTHVPNGREKEYFAEFIAEVNLEQQPEDKIITYSQPVGKVKYSKPSGDFDFDNDYTATAKEQQKKDIQNSVPKVKAAAVAPTKPAIVVSKPPEIAPSKPIPVQVNTPEYKSTPEKTKVVAKEPDAPPKPIVKNKEERIIQKDRLKITTISLNVDGIDYSYKKEEYSWGGVYFYKNERNISESTFRKETE